MFGPESGRVATILVADDRADTRRLLRRMLEPTHRVTEAADGYDALVRLRASPPQLALLDVDMPRMTGIEVCRRIRAEPALASTKVIIMTAGGLKNEASAAAAGADGFLLKPFRWQQLLALVAALVAPDPA